jgi:glycolate oxidase FAD binding subunit
MALTPAYTSLSAGNAATPANEDELATLVREAAQRPQSVLTEGSGTKRHHGSAGSAGARLVSLRRLNRITAYEPGDMVVSVQAGVRLMDLQRTLFEHRQWLPIDPPYANATIGGILATASSGPRRLGYGTAKDMLLGMRIMGRDGGITKSGARVVKNVSGFDLHRLQVGAFGALGIIVEAYFKVSTRPAVMGALLIGQASLRQALETLLRVQRSSLRPVALEALDGGAVAACRTLVPELPGGPGSPLVGAVAVVGIEGSRAVFDRHLADLAPLRTEARVSTLLEGGAADRLWQALREAPARAGDQVTARVAVKPHDLPDLLDELAIEAAAVDSVSAHAGLGIARLRFVTTLAATAIAATMKAWQAAAGKRKGYAVVESAPLTLEGREQLPFRAMAQPLGGRIKEAWDPSSILNPGRSPL